MNQNQLRQSLPILVIVMGGCTTTPDPREGDLLTSIWNLNTGVYERRIEEREARRDAAKQALSKSEEEQQRLNNQEVTTQRELSLLQSQIAGFEQNIQHLSAQVAQMETRRTSAKKKSAQLRSNLSRVKIKVAKLKQNVTTGNSTINYSQKQAVQLQKEIENIWKIYELQQ